MKNIEAWSFLVSCNLYIDYRTVIAPDFICDADVAFFLTQAAGENITKPGTVLYREVYHSIAGQLTLIFRVIPATAENTGLPGNGVLKDTFGRGIDLIEGVVLKGIRPDVYISEATLGEIHEQVIARYCKFWDTDTPASATPSTRFNLLFDTQATDLDYIKLDPYIDQELTSLSYSNNQTKQWESYCKFPLDRQVFSIISFSDSNRIVIGSEQKITLISLSEGKIIEIDGFSGWEVPPDCDYFTPIALDVTEQLIASAMVELFEKNVIQVFNLKSYLRTQKPQIIGEYGSILSLGNSVFKKLSGKEKGLMMVKAVAFSPNSEIVISASVNGKIKLWDIKGKGLERGVFYHDSEVRCLAVDPNSNTLASGDVEGYIKLWNLGSLSDQPIKIIRQNQQTINSLAFSSDGKRLVSGANNGTIKIWDTKIWKKYSVNGQHLEPVNSVAFSPDNNLIASGSDDKTIKIWNLQNQEYSENCTLEKHDKAVTAVVFTPDGKKLISGSKDGTVRVWRPVQK
jgi:WD40 repeat protein